ncbi:MAG TPA: hypothetical protein VHE61_14955 [Opitutaceae bacterium]|nr:hypothetical protein [Opitutaceae bacterium]
MLSRKADFLEGFSMVWERVSDLAFGWGLCPFAFAAWGGLFLGAGFEAGFFECGFVFEAMGSFG